MLSKGTEWKLVWLIPKRYVRHLVTPETVELIQSPFVEDISLEPYEETCGFVVEGMIDP